jgi:hypothetical protein
VLYKSEKLKKYKMKIEKIGILKSSASLSASLKKDFEKFENFYKKR